MLRAALIDLWPLAAALVLVAGCLAGRTTACRAATVGTPIGSHPPPRLVLPTADVDAELPRSTRLLSEMIRDFGDARFGRFWTAGVAPDSAFHLAMDTTLGDWVLARQEAYGTTLVAGPRPSWGAGLFGFGVAALGLLATIAIAKRRQVG